MLIFQKKILSQLSGLPVTTEIECLKAVEKLHEIRSIQTIIVTSGIFANTETREILYCYVSQKTPSRKQYRFEIPVIRGQFVGTGDVFTSLLVVWLNNQNGNVCEAVSNVISSMQSLIKRTSQQCYGKYYITLIDMFLFKSSKNWQIAI